MEKQRRRRDVLGAHCNNSRMLELLIGKLPHPRRIAHRKVRSFGDDNLMYELSRYFAHITTLVSSIAFVQAELSRRKVSNRTGYRSTPVFFVKCYAIVLRLVGYPRTFG